MFYALQTRGGQEGSPDVVIGMFKVFQFNVYALLDPGDTLSFEIPYVAMKFDVLPDIRSFFFVSTPVGDSVVANRVYRKYPIRVTYVYLIELDMLYSFDVLGMDFLNSCYALYIVGTKWPNSSF